MTLSRNPEISNQHFLRFCGFALPTPRITRNFNFDQGRNGQWTINGGLFSCNTARFVSVVVVAAVVHMEEHQVIKGAPGLYDL